MAGLYLNQYKNEIFIFTLGVVIGLLLFSVSYGRLGISAIQWGGNDFIEYWTLASNVTEGHGFSLRSSEPFEPSALRTPGYPLFLAISYALTGGTVLASILQILLYAFLGVLAYWILRELGFGRLLSTVVGVAFLFEPDVASTGIYLISDTLFHVILLGSFLLFLRAFHKQSPELFLLSSLVLGVSALVRPISLAVWGIYFIIWLFAFRPIITKRKLAVLLISLACVVAPIFPWVLRNYQTFGVARISSADTYNLYAVVIPQIVSFRDGVPYRDARAKVLDDFITSEELAPLPKLDNVAYNVSASEFLMADDFSYQTWMQRKFDEAFRGNLRYYGEAVVRGVIEFFSQVNWLTPLEHWEILRPSYQPAVSFVEVLQEEGLSGLANEVVRRFSCGASCVLSFGLNASGRIFWALITALAIAGFILMYRAKAVARPLLIASLLFVAYIAAVHIFFIGALVQPRYRIPIAPFFFGFAFVALQHLYYMIVARNTRGEHKVIE